MTLAQLIDTCNSKGIRLGIGNAGLRVNAPAGVLTAEIREALAEYKPTLLAALAPSEPNPKATQEVLSPRRPTDSTRLTARRRRRHRWIRRKPLQHDPTSRPSMFSGNIREYGCWTWNSAHSMVSRLPLSAWSQSNCGPEKSFGTERVNSRARAPSSRMI